MVGKFQFPAGLELLILNRPRVTLIHRANGFLKTSHALIDCFEGVDSPFVLARRPSTFNGPPPLNFKIHSLITTLQSANKLTHRYVCDFLLFEEADSFLALEDDPTSSEVDPTYQDPEGDILRLEAILNKGDDKLPVIIAKDLKDEEKAALLKVLKSTASHRWKLSDIKGSKMYDGNLPDMIEKTMEVFMDDFSVFGDSFSTCLTHLEKMLKRCEDTNLSLNWEKSHFMIKEGIVLDTKFLSWIEDFSKIARPMTHLLEKETPFVFSEECIDSFITLKRKLTEAPILIALDWDLPFELM
ncbi:hypothetical protein Tco_0503292 [Tanacetum coccineum]